MSIWSREPQWSQKLGWNRLGVVLVTLIFAGGLDMLLRGLAMGGGYELDGFDSLYSYDGLDRLAKLLVIIACFWWISESPRRRSDADLAALKTIRAIEGDMRVRERGRLIEKVIAKGVDLGGTDLRNANLEKMSLQAAKLRRSNLMGADLRKTDLRAANLSAALLKAAQLVGSNLKKAQLNNAYLAGANLTSSDMKGVDLAGAYVGRAEFTAVRNLTTEQIKGAWWMQGDPPIGLPEELASFVRNRFISTRDGAVRFAG